MHWETVQPSLVVLVYGCAAAHVSGVYWRPFTAASGHGGEGLLKDSKYDPETDVCSSHSE